MLAAAAAATMPVRAMRTAAVAFAVLMAFAAMLAAAFALAVLMAMFMRASAVAHPADMFRLFRQRRGFRGSAFAAGRVRASRNIVLFHCSLLFFDVYIINISSYVN
jgi:hypothetical protein